MPAPDGVPFGPYLLIERLGRGGMGETWRAVREGLAGARKELVIKRILAERSEEPRFRQSFIQEAKLSLLLSHGNIAQVFDFGEIDGELYMAMELVRGRPLSDVLERASALGLRALPPVVAAYIGAQTLQGLAHAHGKKDGKRQPLNIVHRDVSPDNLMVSFEGEVKLLDFGVARASMEGRAATMAGVVKGKVMFLSPEQATAQPLDARSDIFSAGLVMYRMLSGRYAVDDPDGNRVMLGLAKGEFRPLSEVAPWVPRALSNIVEKSMQFDRERRHRTAHELADALTQYVHRAAPSSSESVLTGMMAWLFSRELFEAGLEVEISPEVRALLEAERTGATNPKGVTVLNQETVKPVITEPDAKATVPMPELPPEPPTTLARGGPPESMPSMPSVGSTTMRRAATLRSVWFLVGCAAAGFVTVAAVALNAQNTAPPEIVEVSPPPLKPAPAPPQPAVDPPEPAVAPPEPAVASSKVESAPAIAPSVPAESPEQIIDALINWQLRPKRPDEFAVAYDENQSLMKRLRWLNENRAVANLESPRRKSAFWRGMAIAAAVPTILGRRYGDVGWVTLVSSGSEPIGLKVRGTNVGMPPLMRIPFGAGEHELEVSKASGPARSFKFMVTGGKEIRLIIDSARLELRPVLQPPPAPASLE